MSSGKWWPFRLSLNVLKHWGNDIDQPWGTWLVSNHNKGMKSQTICITLEIKMYTWLKLVITPLQLQHMSVRESQIIDKWKASSRRLMKTAPHDHPLWAIRNTTCQYYWQRFHEMPLSTRWHCHVEMKSIFSIKVIRYPSTTTAKLLIYFQTSAVYPLEFGDEPVISCHTIYQMYLSIHVGIKVILC